MKNLLTAALASLALFTFAPVDADAGGKKKNKRSKVHKSHGHNHSSHSYRSHSYRGHNHRSHGSVRFSFGSPSYRSYYRPTYRSYGYRAPYYSRPSYGFSGLSLFFGNSGHRCR